MGGKDGSPFRHVSGAHQRPPLPPTAGSPGSPRTPPPRAPRSPPHPPQKKKECRILASSPADATATTASSSRATLTITPGWWARGGEGGRRLRPLRRAPCIYKRPLGSHGARSRAAQGRQGRPPRLPILREADTAIPRALAPLVGARRRGGRHGPACEHIAPLRARNGSLLPPAGFGARLTLASKSTPLAAAEAAGWACRGARDGRAGTPRRVQRRPASNGRARRARRARAAPRAA